MSNPSQCSYKFPEKLERQNLCVENLAEFLLMPDYDYAQHLTNILVSEDQFSHYAINVDAFDLLVEDQWLGNLMLNYPRRFLLLFDRAAKKAQEILMNQLQENPDSKETKDAIEKAILYIKKEAGPAPSEPLDETVMNNNSSGEVSFSIKPNVHVRICRLPNTDEHIKEYVTSLRSSDMGCLISVPGTIIRTGPVRNQEWERSYECTKCKNITKVEADIEQYFALKAPRVCRHDVADGDECGNTLFELIDAAIIAAREAEAQAAREAEERKAADKSRKKSKSNSSSSSSSSSISKSAPLATPTRETQEVKLQDQVVKGLDAGSIPRSIPVILQDDLVDYCKPGDDVRIVGVLMRRWKSLIVGARADIEPFLLAVHVIVTNEKRSAQSVTKELKDDFDRFWNDVHRLEEEQGHVGPSLQARDCILRAICPQICGMYPVKLALAMSLIGGSPMETNAGERKRGECHMLMIGDPGCGKSQFLRFAAKMTPRSILTTGIGTTSAGLTVMAAKDASTGEWTLEAGALVLADGGVCCIDEFNQIKEHDRAAIHEAMEQQTISVAKATLVTKLSTRATVIAACNPRGPYDLSASFAANSSIASPLLSRFDIVMVLMDPQEEEWDRQCAEFLFAGSIASPARLQLEKEREDQLCLHKTSSSSSGRASTNPSPINGASASASSSSQQKYDGEEGPDAFLQRTWSFDKLRAYIAHVRATFKPDLTKESAQILIRYYRRQRGSDGRNAARTTFRLMEGLTRLAQAHARLMYRDKITEMDALFACYVVEASFHTSSIYSIPTLVKEDFAEDAFAAYVDIERKFKSALDLDSNGEEADDDDRRPAPPPERKRPSESLVDFRRRPPRSNAYGNVRMRQNDDEDDEDGEEEEASALSRMRANRDRGIKPTAAFPSSAAASFSSSSSSPASDSRKRKEIGREEEGEKEREPQAQSKAPKIGGFNALVNRNRQAAAAPPASPSHASQPQRQQQSNFVPPSPVLPPRQVQQSPYSQGRGSQSHATPPPSTAAAAASPLFRASPSLPLPQQQAPARPSSSSSSFSPASASLPSSASSSSSSRPESFAQLLQKKRAQANSASSSPIQQPSSAPGPPRTIPQAPPAAKSSFSLNCDPDDEMEDEEEETRLLLSQSVSKSQTFGGRSENQRQQARQYQEHSSQQSQSQKSQQQSQQQTQYSQPSQYSQQRRMIAEHMDDDDPLFHEHGYYGSQA